MTAVSDAAAVFMMVACEAQLPDDIAFGLHMLGYGSISAVASIHSELCVAAPSAVALQRVTSMLLNAFPHLSFSEDDLRRLRGFAQACSVIVLDLQKARFASLAWNQLQPCWSQFCSSCCTYSCF